MSPLYEYRCPECGHQFAKLLKVYERDRPYYCNRCMTQAERIMSLPAKRTDGIYSYAPNVGNPTDHDRKNDLIERRKEDKDAT